MATDTDKATPTTPAARLRGALHPSQLLPTVLAGLLIGALEVALATSYATLIFNGELLPHLSRGVGMSLFSATVGITIAGLLSAIPVLISSNQDVPGAVVAVAVAAAAGVLAATEVEFATAAVLIALTTLLVGAAFLLLGGFRLTALVRFLPYPVVGGFLAGTGWLLVSGGIHMMSGRAVSPSTLGVLLAPDALGHWLPGVILGGLIYFLGKRVRHTLFLPGMIAGVLVLFYLVAFLRGATLATLSADGWLLGPFAQQRLWQPISAAELGRVQWAAVWPQLPNLLAGVAISAIALLLNVTGLELTLRQDVDLNQEMRAAGWANLANVLGAGFPTYHSISVTVLNSRLGTTSRLSGLTAAVVTGLTLLFGGAALGSFPKLIFGGLLVYLGLSFLWEWVVAARRRLPLIDYAIVLSILVTIAAAGFLPGVAVGVVAAVVMFVVSYSRASVVKHELDGTSFKSRVTRSPGARELLLATGTQAYYLQLQGFIFFGTAYGLRQQVRARARQVDTQYVVLDFRQVIGLDSTALLSFDKMRQLARDSGFVLVVAGLSPALREQFATGGLREETGVLRFAPDLDRAAEWIEDQVCLAAEMAGQGTLDDSLQAIVPGAATTRLIGYLARREIPAGAYLIHQGDAPDLLYFIESGQVTAQLERPGQAPVRLETMRGGRTVGELGFYLGTRRSAAVVAEQPAVVYALTQAELARIERDDPAAANACHRVVVHLLGERVLHLMRAVEALQR